MILLFLFISLFQLGTVNDFSQGVYLYIEPQFEVKRYASLKFSITPCGYDFSYPQDRYFSSSRLDDDFDSNEIKITLREHMYESPCDEFGRYFQNRFHWSAHLIGDDGGIHGYVSVSGHVDVKGIIFTSTSTCSRYKNNRPVMDCSGNIINETMTSIGNLEWKQFSKDLLIETAMLNAFKFFNPMKEFFMPLPKGFNEWELENFKREYPDDFIRIPAKNMTMEECKTQYKAHGYYIEEWDDDVYDGLAKDANKRGELVFGSKSLSNNCELKTLYKGSDSGVFSNMPVGSKIETTIGDLARSPELRKELGISMEELKKIYDYNRRTH